MELYHTFYETNSFVVSITRDNNIVDVCIYDKTGEDFKTLAEDTHTNLSDLQALKLTRLNFNL